MPAIPGSGHQSLCADEESTNPADMPSYVNDDFISSASAEDLNAKCELLNQEIQVIEQKIAFYDFFIAKK